MSARIPAGKERRPFPAAFTYAQREAMRQELSKKQNPYTTYGELVMAIIHGEAKSITVKDARTSQATVKVKVFLTDQELTEIRELAHEEDVTPIALIRNRVFGEEFRSRKRPHDTRRMSINVKTPEEVVLQEALDLLGVKGSLPQGTKYLAMLMAMRILKEAAQMKENTDVVNEAVVKEEN